MYGNSIENGRDLFMETNENYVPLWKKFALTIKEAAEYFGIGEKKLRELARENEDGSFVLQVGVKQLIKRERFEDFLNAANAI